MSVYVTICHEFGPGAITRDYGSWFGIILGDPGVESGAEDEVKTGGKKFDEQKYERKFCSSNFFPPVFDFVFGPTICSWVSEDGLD